MKIVFLDKINSTQDYLKKVLESQDSSKEERYLVYTDHQTHGRGRKQNDWEHTKGSLACSFNMQPHKNFTLTALEIAALISDYFQEKHGIEIKLKWPNDLFYKDKKLGGIIIQSSGKQLCIGIGMNHILEHPCDMRIGVDLSCFNLPDFVNYIHSNRIIEDNDVKNNWLESCHHIKRYVAINDNQGRFAGLGQYGEAIIEDEDGSRQNLITGSLRYI